MPWSAQDSVVYLNGSFIPRAQATVDVEDRGFMFGDGIYEVIRYYRGHAFTMDQHILRLRQSMEYVRLPPLPPDVDLRRVSDELIRRNGLSDARVYWQVTRGSAPRQHAIPDECTPTILAMAAPEPPVVRGQKLETVRAILHPDLRWYVCRIKSVMLLPNVLAKSAAHDTGAAEAILHRDGIVTEGSSTSVFVVRHGELWTHPADDMILGGITRAMILRVAGQQKVPCIERPFTTADLLAADEVFITGTTTHVAAVVQVDHTPISPTGTPTPGTPGGPQRIPAAGPITRQLYDGLIEMILAATA